MLALLTLLGLVSSELKTPLLLKIVYNLEIRDLHSMKAPTKVIMKMKVAVK